MPKAIDGKQRIRLRLPQIKLLRALAANGFVTADKLRRLTGLSGSADDLGLVDLGLARRTRMEVEEGIFEVNWSITEAGLEQLKASGINEEWTMSGTSTTPFSMEDVGKIGTLVPWFGSARMMAEKVGRALDGCKFVCVPFCGGLAELPHIRATTLVCNDLHRHVINLATIAAHSIWGPVLYRRLRRKLFHPEVLEWAQHDAVKWLNSKRNSVEASVDAAEAYFVSQWMGRSGRAGTDDELRGSLSTRWNANGGDSALRWANAVLGLRKWRRILQRCSFSCLDWRVVVAKVKDAKGNGVYADPPWPLTGDAYQHKFGDADQVELSDSLTKFHHARVVARSLDCPLTTKLYREKDGWRWQRFAGRNSGNNAVAEVLLVKN